MIVVFGVGILLSMSLFGVAFARLMSTRLPPDSVARPRR